jgi:hypothetical protein
MEENQDTGLETEPQKNSSTPRGKSPRNRLLDRVKQLDALAKKELKLAKQADILLEAVSLERLLYNDSRDDRNNELTAQVTAQQEEIARLTQANAELKSELQTRTAQRVQPERIPDDRVQGLQEQVSTLESLLKTVATLARSCDIESRTRHAVSLVIKYGRRKELMSAVEGLGVDFSSVAVALQKSETELLGLLQQAQQEGTGTPIWRAVLAVKYQVQVDGHGKRQYRDEFSESSLYADSL